MGILDNLFGSTEDNKKQIIELWKSMKKMPESQLKDIAKYKPNTTHGKFAFLLLCKGGSNGELLKHEMVLPMLETMLRSDGILLGVGPEFEEIRAALKQTLRRANPSKDY